MEPRRLNACRDCIVAFRRANVTTSDVQATAFRLSRRSIASYSKQPHTLGIRAQPPSDQADHQRGRAILPRPRTYATAAAPYTPDLNTSHARIHELSASVLRQNAGQLPAEQRVLYVLEQLQSIANGIIDERGPDRILRPAPGYAPKNRQQETATSALLGSVNSRRQPTFVTKASILDLVSEIALEIVRHPHVFISPAVLKAYVELQSSLQQPWSFPDVFEAYASKPSPKMKNGHVELVPVSPDHMNAAIDEGTANTALSAAMLSHNLPLAIDVITTSFSTSAFRKAKIFKQAAVPIGGLTLAPFAAYTISSSFSNLQSTMDPSMATGIAFAGFMTYIGAVSVVGYVTITTANDQMDRVTWASGVPLWERWVREAERAAADRLASAWGFKDRDKRGEEEGEDWETLREWVGHRGMILDRVNLMEGME